jgi:sorbitol/mannitol transport system substrate-binding protein
MKAKFLLGAGLLAASAIAAATIAHAQDPTTLTIATVNNPDMVTMQKLSDNFEAANPDIKLNWVRKSRPTSPPRPEPTTC